MEKFSCKLDPCQLDHFLAPVEKSFAHERHATCVHHVHILIILLSKILFVEVIEFAMHRIQDFSYDDSSRWSLELNIAHPKNLLTLLFCSAGVSSSTVSFLNSSGVCSTRDAVRDSL